MDLEFIKFTINWDKTKKKLVDEALEKNKSKKILIFKNRKNLNNWYEQEFKQKIEIY